MSKYKLFTVEHSYFSGKIKSYLNWKFYKGSLGDGFENILATPELITNLLLPKSGVPSLPQMEAPDGTWIQDSSSIYRRAPQCISAKRKQLSDQMSAMQKR